MMNTMRPTLWLWGIAALGIVLILVLNYVRLPEQPRAPMATSGIQIAPIQHSTAVISFEGTLFYTDPVGGDEAFTGQSPANIILLTDIHGDHLDAETLLGVRRDATLVAPQSVFDELPEALQAVTRVVNNGETIEEQGFSITAIPMYNHPESENAKFHTKGRGNGYLIEKNGKRLYIAGDTAGVPEMRALTNIDVALVPMNLPYTMDVDEAADAVLAFAPRHVYPYHYRGPTGFSDVARFKELVEAQNPDIDVVLLNWYPD